MIILPVDFLTSESVLIWKPLVYHKSVTKSTRAKRKSLTSGLTFGYIRILASYIGHCDHCHCQQP